jgi:bacterial/archaeal transporter family-2 protein
MIRLLLLLGIGVGAGASIALQSITNAALSRRTGNFGSILIVTLVGIAFITLLILLFPSEAKFNDLPRPNEWYLYLGGFFGILIVLAPIVLVPRIGTTATLSAIVVGQLVTALVIDHFALFGMPRIEITIARVIGLVLLLVGAFLLRP